MSQAELNLDQLLAGMAEDVPPMPAGFHDQWMNAVREEAKQAETPAPAPVSQWPKILSVAAVFVFLIYRSARKPLLPANEAVSTMAVTEGAVNEEAAAEEAAAENAATVENAMEAVYEAAASAGETDAAAVPAAGSGNRKELGAKSAEVSYAAEAMTEEEAAAEDASVPAYFMEAAEEAEEEAVSAAPVTKAPVTEAPVTEAPAAGMPERTGIGGFFADMGDFLLEVWPFVLIALVPLAVAAGVKKFRKK